MNDFNKLMIILMLLFGTSSFALSQNTYTYKEGLEIGLERNFDIRLVRNDLKIAENNMSRGNAGQLPKIDLNAAYGGSLNNTNIDYTNGLHDSYNNTFNNNVSAGVNLDWTIFNGFSLQTNYAKLKELKAQGELYTRLTIEDFIATFSTEYYGLVKQILQLKNLQMSLDLSYDRLQIVEASFIIGASSGLDYQQTQVDYNEDFSALIAQEEEVQRIRIRLNNLLAFDQDEDAFCVTDTIMVFDSTLVKEEIWAEALKNNTSLLLAIQNNTISELDYKTAKSRNYPYLRMNAGYGYNQHWYQNSSTAMQNQFGLNFGLTAGINIFDGMNRRREQQNARIQIENSELMMEQYLSSLKADLANLWLAYTNNIKLWELEKRNQVVASSNFEIAMERYRLRELSGLELREAQLSLLKSEERLLTAVYNIKICEISLMLLSGNIIEHSY
ncbi:TolC family protein [Bacteroidales bacterium OttesenSCG-928-K03]|nr:TolC family protein [Bacteroidales bacterium OttesenSCG-928-K22]MDL2242514.1 TolC family protein [Bacteroidales bacterium OttesenSCG-928-K03]